MIEVLEGQIWIDKQRATFEVIRLFTCYEGHVWVGYLYKHENWHVLGNLEVYLIQRALDTLKN